MAASLFGITATLALCNSDPPYDNQVNTYTADLPPVSSVGTGLIATPYFSPDWSSNVTVELINAATTTIDIETPSFASWSGCTPFTDAPQCTKGCSAPDVMAEEFPVMPALLNAIHQRGVSVRILTNDYGTPDCVGTYTPLTVLLLNGASIRWYNQTTFMHAKYMAIDA